MIRKITVNDKEKYIEMAKAFYSSEAVLHTIPSENFELTFDEMMRSNDYAEGFLFEEADKTVGYALLAKTFSQEAGGLVCWLEELYLIPSYRGKGIGKEFLDYLKALYPQAKRFRLEVTDTNKKAISLYEKKGFISLDYLQMYMDID